MCKTNGLGTESSIYSVLNTKTLWWLLQGCPPLSISNREVKPTCADGTAFLRVGEYVDANFKNHLGN